MTLSRWSSVALRQRGLIDLRHRGEAIVGVNEHEMLWVPCIRFASSHVNVKTLHWEPVASSIVILHALTRGYISRNNCIDDLIFK